MRLLALPRAHAEHVRLRSGGDRLSPARRCELMEQHGPLRRHRRDRARHHGAGLRIGIVMSRFNPTWVKACFRAAPRRLRKLGVRSLEHAHRDRSRCARGAARVAEDGAKRPLRRADRARRSDPRRNLSFRDRVERDRRAASRTVQLDTGVPIANGILTTENDDQALARMMEKGADCAAGRDRDGESAEEARRTRSRECRKRVCKHKRREKRSRPAGTAVSPARAGAPAGARANSRSRACTNGSSRARTP